MHRSARSTICRIACLFAFAALLWPGAGWGTSRVALVVGNSGYDGTSISRLRNPVNDAELMARTLEGLGFQVTLATDADQAKMKASIKEFGKQLSRAGQDAVGLFFYAGHGAEAKGHNYLIPIGADIEIEMDYQTDGVPADWVLNRMGAAGNRLNIVILDACRDNPLQAAYRSGSTGLAPMSAPSGTLIAYSAAPKQKAKDGDGKNSPYTEQLAKFLINPGLKVEDVFKRVRVAVEEMTGGEQTPWENSSLRGDFYFVAKVEKPPPKPAPKTVVKTKPSEPTVQQLAARAYEAAERVNTISSYRLFVEQYPDTLYAKLAGEQIRKLETVVTHPAPPAESVEASLGLKPSDREQIQIALWALGFNTGPPDGKFGSRTREAIRKWQASRGHETTGHLDAGSKNTLLAAVPDLSGPIWLTAQNKPCKVWHPYPKAGETLTWSGSCVDGKAYGGGRLVWQGSHGKLVYEGEFRNGKAHGQGTSTSDGDRYEGEYRDGKRHGRGTVTWASGGSYEGEWRNDVRRGEGTTKYNSGSLYEGKWKDDKPHGWGVYTHFNGKIYKGNWTKGCFWEGGGRWAGLETTKKACGFDVKESLMKVAPTRSAYGDETKDWNVLPTTNLRTKSISAKTPTKHPLAHTITTKALHKFIIDSLPPVVLIDVLNDEDHRTMPGAVWLKGAGKSYSYKWKEADLKRRLDAALHKITSGDKATALVFFCRGETCWYSYNAALRTAALGYKNVYWYRGGITAWEKAWLPTEKAVETQW